jgi:hypothetical protein
MGQEPNVRPQYNFIITGEDIMNDRNNARFLRVAIVRNVLRQGLLDRDDALEILSGCLTPGDETTRVDDRDLLDIEDVKDVIFLFELQELADETTHD